MSLRNDVISQIIHERQFDAIKDYVDIVHPNNPKVVIEQYDGTVMRLYPSGGCAHIMIPKELTVTQECGLATALSTGSIFDDLANVENNTKYIQMRTLPMNALANRGCEAPCGMKPVVAATVGTMDDETGHAEVTDADISNGIHLVKDLMDHKEKHNDVNDVVDRYLGASDHAELPQEIKVNTYDMKKDLEDVDDVTDEDELNDDDYEEIEIEDDDDDATEDKFEQEGFLLKKPKKLKPIPRDIVAYITSEMNAIRDANDQAMLSGYTCSKLELVDFYLNIIDTNDTRYVVPHSRDYLVQMQNDLNRLLTQILQIKPINRNDRVWKANVTAPDNWR